ncbi:glycerol-3-phosphate dehydrogenase [Psychromonas sp. CNPT3]|uniref:glycerol-3-phosphate dehydrogenase n=1 Tax=Psychromonas sp. CNPT3 TaxID=314282 RepID=UPI00006E5822|nr:glycerol-3-phosphate dehydrogenase [Psychromonas sp. CNPT3]AGH80421.1 glycerol-3-phosphate dehydrogenase [Psychromonas sp. CNPT3]
MQREKEDELLDIIIVGGGINGAGIAADASGRGLKVALFEAKDFASATSSASSKLLHGGLRYLEHYDFRLVSEALAEREIILRKAPHIVKGMRFRLPHRPFLRPAWMIRMGLFLYDHLGKRSILGSSHQVDLAVSGLFKKDINIGFEYSDCWVDDARLVILNVIDAKERGAEVHNYCRVVNAEDREGIWHVSIVDETSGRHFIRKSKVLVNATGPWVKQFFDEHLKTTSPRNIRLVKGSHIVVPKIHNEEYAYILQNRDERIVFVIPYLHDFSMIGTTDVSYEGDPREVEVSVDEINYLINVVNDHFVKQINKSDIVWSYSGVRPLCDNGTNSPQTITRDYTLTLQQNMNKAPLLSIFGGKLTTYRRLAESAMLHLASFFPSAGGPWTEYEALPGGDFSCSKEQLCKNIRSDFPWLNISTAKRYIDQYGTLAWKIFKDVHEEEDMGMFFATGVYAREIDYLIEYEFVKKLDDMLWRRTKLGIYLSDDQKLAIASYMKLKI